MKKYRSTSYRKHWSELVARFGSICVYCRDEPATQIDHVIPVSYYPLHIIENLRPCCGWCNLLASDKVFETFAEKDEFLRKARQTKRNKQRRTTCSKCWLPYQNPLHVRSFFYCPECYDEEYETQYRYTAKWRDWLRLLEEAEIDVDLHRRFKERAGDINKPQMKRLIYAGLVEEAYAVAVGEDDDQ